MVVVDAEVVGDLVDHRGTDLVDDLLMRVAHVAQRESIDGDLVGHGKAAVRLALGERDAFVQAEDAGLLALVGHHDHHVVHELGQPVGDAVERVGDEVLERVHGERVHSPTVGTRPPDEPTKVAAVAFPKKLLNQSEEIILDLRPHWWQIFPASVGLGAAVLFGLIVLIADWHNVLKVLVGLLVLAALGYFVQRYIRWTSENFVVTNERVIYRSGVVAKSGVEIPLDRINTVFFNQSLFERMLGAGDLGVESAGEGGQQTFEAVRKPNLVQQEIYRAMEANEKKTFQEMGQATAQAINTGMAAGAAAAGPSIPEQIEQLDALRQQGTITDEEFEAKKRDLLDRM